MARRIAPKVAGTSRRGQTVVLAAAVLLLAWVGGCCSVAPPPAEKFFNRDTPQDTLKGFVYAVDAHQWDYAYASLSETTREEFGQLRMEVAIRFLDEPKTGIALFDLISNAVKRQAPPQYDIEGRHARILVVTRGKDDGGRPVYFEVVIYFVLEKAEGAEDPQERREWHLDLMRSLEGNPA